MAKSEPAGGGVPEKAEKKDAGRKSRKTFKKRGEKRVVHHGFAHIQASFNNTVITITDTEGNVIAWSSAGGIGFKGSARDAICSDAGGHQRGQCRQGFGLRSVEVKIKGPGSGRESASGAPDDRHRGQVDPRRDSDPHNGCRPPKRRRV